MKRFLLFLSLSFLASYAYADEDRYDDHYKVEGRIWGLKDGDIKKISAELYLPPRGEGSIFMHLHSHRERMKKTVEALNYFIERKNGRSVFYIIFPYHNENEVVVMKGSYMRDEDLALYSGEIFVGPKDCAMKLGPDHTKLHDGFMFKGTFHFKDRIIRDRN